MAPMSNQVVSITEKISDYDIKTIVPLHGPAIEYSLKSFLNDYIRWGKIYQLITLRSLLYMPVHMGIQHQ